MRQGICIKGRAACPMVGKVGITPFRLAERKDERERETGGGIVNSASLVQKEEVPSCWQECRLNL